MLPGKKLAAADVMAMARRRAWLIIIPPLVALFAALLYSRTLQSAYQSDMLISIVPQRVPDTFVRSTVTLRTDERFSAISVEVLSRTNLEQMIETFDLYPTERATQPISDVILKMREAIQVELERPRPGPRGPEPPQAFHVRFTYSDPETAATVTQRLGSLFVDINAKDRGALAGATDKFLSAKLAEARQRLEEQDRRLEAFRAKHGAELPTQAQGNLQAIQSTQLQVQAIVESLARDRDRKLMLERLHSEARAEPAPSQPVAPVDRNAAPVTVSAQQRLEGLQAELAAAELRLKPEHPDIIRLRRLIAETEPKAAAERAARAGAGGPPTSNVSVEESQRRERLRQMAAEIESLDRQITFKETEEQRLRSVASEYQRRVDAVPGLESEWSALTRDYETLQQAYRDLLNKSEASKVSMDLEEEQIGERFRIVDPAGVPVHPVGSARLRVNGIGLALGLVFGFGLAALLEYRDASFRSPADVMDVLMLPVLANVPQVYTAAEIERKGRLRLLVSGLGLASVVAAGYVVWTLKLWNSVI